MSLQSCYHSHELTTSYVRAAVKKHFISDTYAPLFNLSISPLVRCLPCLCPLFFCLYRPGLWPCCFSSFAAIFAMWGKSAKQLPVSYRRNYRGVSLNVLQNKSASESELGLMCLCDKHMSRLINVATAILIR